MINEVRHKFTKKGIQTAVILPNFISWIVINGLLYAMFSTSSGVIVGVMRSFGLEGRYPIFWRIKNSFRAVILISYLWKSGGFGTIVYLAAIAELIRNFMKRPRLTEPAVGASCGTLRCRR